MTSFFPRPLVVSTLLVALFAGAGCSKETRFERRVSAGDKQLAAGQYDIAEAEYRAALQISPNDSKVFGRLGILAYRQGRIPSGYFLLQGALKSYPEDIELQLVYGLASLSMAKSADARTAAKKVIEAQPTNEEGILLLVESCVTTRDNEETRRIVEELQQKHPNVAVYPVALGILQMVRNDLAAAEVEFRKALAIDPKSSAANSYIGNLYIARGEQQLARDALKIAAENSPVRAPRRLKYVEFLLRTGDEAEAKKQLSLITAQAKDYIPALTIEMKLAFKDGKVDESDKMAENILAHDRLNYDALMQRAAVKLSQGDVDGVIAALKNAQSFYERAPQLKYQLALAYLKKGENTLAEENLQQAISISPNYDEAILLLAEQSMKKGDADNVIYLVTPVLRRSPRLVQGYVLLARAHQARNHNQETLMVLRALLEITPKAPESAYLLGMAQYQQGQFDDARASFELAIKNSESYWPALEMLVEGDLRQDRKAAAAQRVDELIAKYATVAGPYIFRAKLRLLDNNPTGAETDLLKAIELDPKAQPAYVQLARIYFQGNRNEQAVEKLSAIAATAPTPGIQMQLGMLYSALKRNDAAQKAYEKALALDPRFTPALNNLSLLYAEKLGQVEKGYTLARQAWEISPSDPMVADTLGWIHYYRGQYETGLPLLQTSVEAFPGDPDILYHLAMIYYQLGLEENARQTFQRALATTADSPNKVDARSRLDVLAIDPAKATPAIRSDLEAKIQRQANDVVALVRLGAIKEIANQPQEAAGHYEAALKTAPRSFSTLLALVHIYVGPLRNPAKARDLARNAHNLQPTDGQAAWKFGRLIYEAQDYPWATSLLQEAARQLPNQSDVLFDLAQAQYAIGRVPEAEASLKQALADQKLSGRDAAQRMATLIAAKTPALVQAALPEARKVLTTEPANIPALMVAAQAAEQQKDYQGARQTYDKVLAANSAFAPAQRRLAILYAEQLGDDQKAEDFANRARQVFNDDPELAYALGTINYRKGDYNAAQRFLRQSLAKRENHAETLFFLGMSQYQLKNLPESRTQLQKALQNNLPEQESHEARRVLQELNRGRSQG